MNKLESLIYQRMIVRKRILEKELAEINQFLKTTKLQDKQD